LENTLVEPKRLLILACSQRKRPNPGLLPAIERYDGPQFQVLRKFLLEQPVKAQSVDIFVLSANFGLISANQPTPNYDYKMSPQRAQELQPKVTCALEQVLQVNPYSELFISLGQNYWQALVGYERLVPMETQVTVAEGSQGGRQAEALAEGHTDSTNYQSSFVLVDGQRVAPKWLVSQLTGLPVNSFHTGDARRVLQQLGIEVRSI
jgi:hypothetical protein